MASEERLLLLDVNAFLALAWPNHQFHEVVVERLERRKPVLWATCAITQLGFVRLSCNPSVVEVRKTPGEAIALLQALTSDRQHRYLGTLPPLTESEERFRQLAGHQQVTDAYLVAIAAANNATLLTLDGRIRLPSNFPALVEVLTA